MKYVFVIQGYDEKDAEGRLNDVVTLELFAETSDKAIKRAQRIIKKKFYRISSVIEKEDDHVSS